MSKFWPPNPAPSWMYASKIDPHQARKAAGRLGKDYDKAPKSEAKTFAEALSSGESTSTSSTKLKGKAIDKPEKGNQFCIIMNLPGSKNNNNKVSTLAAHAKSQFGLDLTEVSFLVPPPPQKKTINTFFFKTSSFHINLVSFNSNNIA